MPLATCIDVCADVPLLTTDNKIQACRCDGGFYGTDCSKRLCPRGNDPITVVNHNGATANTANLVEQGEVYEIQFRFQQSGTAAYDHTGDFNFFIEVDTMWNTTERSRPITIPNTVIKAGSGNGPSFTTTYLDATHEPLVSFVRALIDLEAISDLYLSSAGDVTVAGSTYGSGSGSTDQPTAIESTVDGYLALNTAVYVVKLRFRLANPLRLHDVRVHYNQECYVAGCYPLLPKNAYPNENPANPEFPGGFWIDPIDNAQQRLSVPAASVQTVIEADPRDESEECSQRGLCDYTTGLCTCFSGFYGNACEMQTILV